MPSRTHIQSSSPLFRTNTAGDILLRPEWIELLDALRAQGEWIVQSRHPYARLFSRAALPDWQIAPDCETARDPHGALHLTFPRWHHAVARLQFCDCCDSPGFIEIFNASGQAVLQFRAPADRSIAQLAEIPAAFATASGLAPLHLPRGTPTLFPIFNREAPARRPATILPELLESLATSHQPVRFRLHTAESDHRRSLHLRHIAVENDVLTASDGADRCCQLILPAAHTIVLEPSAEAQLLHVVAADDSILLTLADDTDGASSRPWSTALAQFFPHHAQS